MNCTCYRGDDPDEGNEMCLTCTLKEAERERMNSQPVLPPRDWKPERGEEILAKCMYLGFAPGCNDIVRVRFGDIEFAIPLSSIRPMTRKERER